MNYLKPYNKKEFISYLENAYFEATYKYEPNSKSTLKYYNVECGFDIETTSTEIYEDGQEKKFAFMYLWGFGIKDYIVYGRTWQEFIDLCETLQETLELYGETKIICYVHNLPYEFQFMRKYFAWDKVFAVDDRKAIKATTTFGIEFRDSYILSGYSLSKLADNLVSHKIEKLYGDLDYSLIRTHETPITDKELGYLHNDVQIILYYINEQIEQYGDITKIPLTNTGRVRQFVKNNCLHYNKNHKKEGIKGKIGRYRELMHECILNPDEYLMLKRCFMGGFTHASMQYSGELLENVSSIDFTSSYPAVMLMEKFPMSRPIKVDLRKEDFWKLVNDDDTGLMFDCKITGLHANNPYESYLSESKCFDVVNSIVNNGRIFEAESLTTTITDIDLKIIKKCYTWDKIEVANCYKFYMQYLPKQILMSILELYSKKTTLKGVEGKEVEYLVSKGMLNSVYGMCVTDIVRGEIEYNEDVWVKQGVDAESLEEQINKYNLSKNRFLYYPWGVWVTAWARRNLWMGILNIGNDYVYSDTDSIKFLNEEKHKDFIEWYNNNVEMKLKRMCDFRKIDFNLCKPKTIKGVEKLIGVWDYEGNYTRFKTLGAKRYLYEENGKLHLTVAGLSKRNGLEYMLEQCDNDNTKVFEMFNDDLYIPSDRTGKNTHTYIDDEMEGEITDYLGNKTFVKSLSSVHLSECEFTLSISKQYNKFLLMLRDGYLFTGNRAV